jgi:hypothetical protein
MHDATEGKHAAPLVVHMMRRMRQQTFAVVGSVERQIIRAKEIIASSIDHVVAVAAYHQSLPVQNLLFAQRQRQISTNGNRDMQSAAHKRGFNDDWELDMKSFRDIEGAGERQIDRPTALEKRDPLAPLKRLTALVL